MKDDEQLFALEMMRCGAVGLAYILSRLVDSLLNISPSGHLDILQP